MHEDSTTAVIQRYPDAMPGDTAAEPVVRKLLGRAVGRLRPLCATFLYKRYARLTRPPVNLETDELLGGAVAGLIKAPQTARPTPCAGSSRWPTSTCAGSSMTWPAA
jgi:RNA polymerase sigma-70 factor (ECF subfamily)